MLVRISSWPFKGRKKEKQGTRYWLHRTKDSCLQEHKPSGERSGEFRGKLSAAWDTHCDGILQNRVHLAELQVDVSSANSPQQPLKGSHPLPVYHASREPGVKSEEDTLLRNRGWGAGRGPLETWGCEAIEGPPPAKQDVRTQPCLAHRVPALIYLKTLWPPVFLDMIRLS